MRHRLCEEEFLGKPKGVQKHRHYRNLKSLLPTATANIKRSPTVAITINLHTNYLSSFNSIYVYFSKKIQGTLKGNEKKKYKTDSRDKTIIRIRLSHDIVFGLSDREFKNSISERL